LGALLIMWLPPRPLSIPSSEANLPPTRRERLSGSTSHAHTRP